RSSASWWRSTRRWARSPTRSSTGPCARRARPCASHRHDEIGRAGHFSMTRAERIRAALAALSPIELAVVDDSARHAGHAGAAGAAETLFLVTIASRGFEGRTRIERQRMVYALLDAELRGGLHALQLTTRTPAEAR